MQPAIRHGIAADHVTWLRIQRSGGDGIPPRKNRFEGQRGGSRLWRLPAGSDTGQSRPRRNMHLVCEAVDMGISFIDTAPIYSTIDCRRALSLSQRSVVVATKASVGRNGEWRTPAQMVESLESSLRLPVLTISTCSTSLAFPCRPTLMPETRQP